jgi:hypothetical protein
MELLDRYLQAVKKHLPWQRQDDIIAELRANLEAQLEDKETGLGRPLTTGEAEAWLKQMGPPVQVAGRYNPQRYLIGPAVFPTYWFVLRTVFLWAIIIYSIVCAVRAALEIPSGAAVLEAVLRVPVILMTAAAWVTLIFAALEFAVTHYLAKWRGIAGSSFGWSPADLPPVEKEPASGKKPRSYAHAVAEVIFGFLFLVWLLLVPQHPYLLSGPGAAYLRASPFQLAPVWVQFFWWVVALNLLHLGWRLVHLWRGNWHGPRTAQQSAMSALGLIPVGLLLSVRDHAYVTLGHPALDQVRYGGNLDTINQAIYHSALFLCAIAVLELFWQIGRISVDVYRKRAAAMQYPRVAVRPAGRRSR